VVNAILIDFLARNEAKQKIAEARFADLAETTLFDGGWPVSWHGWLPSPFRFRFEEESSTSHATVQGMWMVYMLKYRYPQWIEKNYQ
jgi:hypothetical protein